MTDTHNKRRTHVSALAFSMLALAGGAAQAATLVDSTTTGLYNNGIGTVLDGTNPFGGNFMFPLANVSGGDPSLDIPAGSEPDLSAAAASLGNWLSTPTTPGGSWSASDVAIPGSWAVNTETAIIYEIDGGATGLMDVSASFGIDNGVFVWLNGSFLGGHLRPGGASLGEFVIDIGSIGAGRNYLQILREDHGGGTGYAISVTGEAASIVPLPATGLLLIGALGGLAAFRRSRSQSV
jgi:hypothetical protein